MKCKDGISIRYHELWDVCTLYIIIYMSVWTRNVSVYVIVVIEGTFPPFCKIDTWEGFSDMCLSNPISCHEDFE